MSEADAIEAAARVLRPGMSVDQAARAAYAAIAPIVRRDVAEEIASEIEADADEKPGDGSTRYPGWMRIAATEVMREMATIIREIGERK